MARYHDVLRTKIYNFVSISKHTTLSSLLEEAKENERELELKSQQRKRKQDQFHTLALSVKKPRVTELRSGDQEILGY